MNAREFLDKLKLTVNGPRYRGDPQPQRIDTGINETAFDDNLRFKEHYTDRIAPDTICLKWVSQAWPKKDAHEECIKFCNEVARCVKEVATLANLEEQIDILIELESRDYSSDFPEEFFQATIHVIPEGNSIETFIWKD